MPRAAVGVPRVESSTVAPAKRTASRARRRWVYIGAAVALVAIVAVLAGSRSSKTTRGGVGGVTQEASAAEKKDAAEKTDRLIAQIKGRAKNLDSDQRARDAVAPPPRLNPGVLVTGGNVGGAGASPGAAGPTGSENGTSDAGAVPPADPTTDVPPVVDPDSGETGAGGTGSGGAPDPGTQAGNLTP